MSVEKFLRLLQPITLAGVGAVRRSSHDRLVERLSDLEFITRGIVVGSTPEKIAIELQILDDELLFQLLAGEAHRFLLAAILSHSRSKQVQVANVAWQAVEHYYSAYYAVHYLLRLSGRSLTSLDGAGVAAILRNNLLGAPLPNIPEGLYELSCDVPNMTVTLRKKQKGGGSHQDAWAMWAEMLSEMQAVADQDPVEYASESMALTVHKKFLVRSTGKYRPPEIRGEINYQFRGKCWRFEKNAVKDIALLQKGITDSSMLSQSKDDAATLLRNNHLIFSIATALFNSMAERYPRSIARSLRNQYKDLL